MSPPPTLRQLEDWERRLLALLDEMRHAGDLPSKLENLTRYAHDEAKAAIVLMNAPRPEAVP